MEVYHVSTSRKGTPSFSAGTRAYSRQPQRMVGGLQERSLSKTCQTRSAHNGVESGGYCRASGKAHRRTGGKMSIVFSPALRPSHPHVCRKRTFRQGHALASGLIHSRATDEEASGGGSVKGSPQTESAKATIQETGSRLSRFFRIPTRGDNNTCKSAPACAPQSSPHTCAVTARPAFICPRRHARYADLALRRILPTRLAHGVQPFAAYRLPMCRIFIWCRHHVHQRHAGYNSAPHPIRTRSIPGARIMRTCFCTDTCS